MGELIEIKKWVENRMALFPEDYDNFSLSQRAAYDAYLNVLNAINDIENNAK